ncbi:thioredoxin family protein [Terrimonas sp. NA20]|uniref:Thioredoxin family protein n=1 Tax=Terrimonas ginsenosidimutans TaxID=2908004 RepID=A0ABS9KVK2_9BACT|nr:thioredoxin family protein [Terrimonas ginsenosidimutans]MCG2616269.1 thioredoxin family protein [Terrimonas ginsenosidimutans]
MRYILMAWLCLALPFSQDWMSDMSKAAAIARDQKKLILLNFSGSDWCAPCVRLKKEILQSTEFGEAASSLVLVNADFPRNRKNQLSKEQQQLNNELADRYNPEGKFPYTLLLNAEGKVLRAWDGFPSNGKTAFLEELKKQSIQNAPK